MNERIQELADEAAKFSAIMALPTGQSGDKLFVEKFALLLIRECVGLCNEIGEYGEYPESEAEACAEYILEHFGVE